MASKRTLNRLYWALVNALNDKDVQNADILEEAYRDALVGATDTQVLTVMTEDALMAIEEIHGPAGLRQVGRARPRWIREHVDSIRDTARRVV